MAHRGGLGPGAAFGTGLGYVLGSALVNYERWAEDHGAL